jgi:hypothetical protein
MFIFLELIFVQLCKLLQCCAELHAASMTVAALLAKNDAQAWQLQEPT